MKRLSIVIPVYKVEKYIRETLLSVINQDPDLFDKVEIIIVNDGTPDRSIDVIKDLIEDNPNIILINQTNQGLSMARNNGFAVAKGDYVWFVDSDDWIIQNALTSLFPHLDGRSDTIVMGAIEVWDDKENDFHIYFPEVVKMSGKETFRRNCAQHYTSVLSVYRTEFLRKNNITFLPGVLHEDNVFCPIVSYLSEITTFIPNKLYRIRRATKDGRQSITTTVNPKRAYDALIVCESLLKFANEKIKEDDIRLRFNNLIALCLNNNVFPIIRCCNKNEIIHFNQLYHEKYSHFNKCLETGGIKTKLESFLFYIFSRNIIGVFNFMQMLNPKRYIGVKLHNYKQRI